MLSHDVLLQPAQNFHGLVQRLVQKEKQVAQLQTELQKYSEQNPIENREAVCIYCVGHVLASLLILCTGGTSQTGA